MDEAYPINKREESRTVYTSLYSHVDHVLLADLELNKINTIVLVGGFPEHCITATAMHLFDLNFDVIVLKDVLFPDLKKFKHNIDTSLKLLNSGTVTVSDLQSFLNIRKKQDCYHKEMNHTRKIQSMTNGCIIPPLWNPFL